MMEKIDPTFAMYELSKARNYLLKARKIFKSLDLLQDKEFGDFYSILKICDQVITIKHEEKCRLN